VGPSAVAALAGLRADVAFVGADSLVAGKGLYSADQDSAAILAAIGACAERVIAVVDHTKIGAGGLFLGLPQERIDCVITDAGVAEETRALLQAQPFRLIVAPSES
jgi:DeoR/GlpR family transcriptional regulator of sugar metabolism